MQFQVDLRTCQDHGQCAFVSQAFRLAEDGSLAFRQYVSGLYLSDDMDDAMRDELEEAADACPVQAIRIRD